MNISYHYKGSFISKLFCFMHFFIKGNNHKILNLCKKLTINIIIWTTQLEFNDCRTGYIYLSLLFKPNRLSKKQCYIFESIPSCLSTYLPYL